MTTQRLHVSIVADALRRQGGADRSLVLMANGLVERGHRVTALVRADGIPSDAHWLDGRVTLDALPATTAIKQRWIRVPALVFALARRLRLLRPDAVVAFKPENAIPALLAGVAARVPVVVSERVSLEQHRHYWHWRLGRRVMYRRAASLVVQTPRLVADARRVARKASVHVVPNMVTVPAATDGASVWDRFPSGRPPGRLITIARLDYQKGLDRLIDAFGVVAESVPGWCLAIVGAGPLEDDLQERLRRTGLESRARLMGTVDDPFPSLRDSHAFALASRYEGFPNALVEAMAVGLPVVAFDCPTGPRELIRDGVNGLLVADGDEEAFASALTRVMTDESLRGRLGESAKVAAQLYAPARIIEQWEDVLYEAKAGS